MTICSHITATLLFLAGATIALPQSNPPANQISCKGSQGVTLIPVSQVPPGTTGLNVLFSVPQDCLQLDPVSFTIDRSNPQRPVVRLITQPGGGAPAINFQDSEALGGTPDGIKNQFTVLSQPLGTSLHVYRNGIRLTVTVDFTVAVNVITFLPGIVLQNGTQTGLPQTGDILTADYRCTPSASCVAH